MLSEQTLKDIVKPVLIERDLFLVDVKISRDNKIKVLVDGVAGITIQEIAKISREIENSLDRDTDDFELEVSSPGLDYPFKVHEQYVKNIGRDLEVTDLAGEKQKGKLLEVSKEEVILEAHKKISVPGKKKKQQVTEKIIIKKDNIKSAKVIIKF